jgi:phosphatidylglycerophosphatase C
MGPTADVAAFDFDGTLTEGGSVLDFLVAVAGRTEVLSATAALAPRLAVAAVMGGSHADQTKELLFERVLAGVPLGDVTRVSERFARQHLARHLRAPVRDRFDQHRDRGDRVVIVSASPELYVRVAGDLLGADGVVATRLAVTGNGGDGVGKDGSDTLTGRYDGANCRGQEKLRRLRMWMDEHGGEADRFWAYGNSRGDLSMLGAADVGVNVGRLGRFGKLRSFPELGRTRLD